MTHPRWLTAVFHFVAGRDPRVRRATSYVLGSGIMYALTTAMLMHATAMGLLATGVARTLGMSMAVTFFGFLLLVRSGWSQRADDPVLTLPLALSAVFNITLAYVLVGEYRGDVVILMAHTVGIAMLRLPPRHTLLLGVAATLWIVAAQVGLVAAGAPDFTRDRAVAHFMVIGTSLLSLGLVGSWVSSLRVRMRQQDLALREALAQARELATTDMLTGLMNRRSMDEALKAEMQRSERSAQPFCVAVLDLDHFKRVNDLHGHRAGDAVLQAFARLAQRELRQVDRMARWGGEEFLVLMPCVDVDEGLAAIERLRLAAEVDGLHPQGLCRITVSAGLTSWQSGDGIGSVFERADQALYRAKQQGRNRVHVQHEPVQGADQHAREAKA